MPSTIISQDQNEHEVFNRARSYMTVIDLLHNLTYIKNYKNSVILTSRPYFLSTN